MIIAAAPFRVSMFGGGTDYPSWSHIHGGASLGFAINKYCYLTVRKLPPYFTYRHRICYSRIELVDDARAIEHPAVCAVLADQCVEDGLEITHAGDIPAQSGMGSSSAFVVALLHALAALRGHMIGKRRLAEEAIRIEQRVLAESVGDQDQVFSAFGGFNRLDFSANGFRVNPITTPIERQRELLDHLMLVFTGFQRYASDIARQQIANFTDRATYLHRMRALVDEAQSVIMDQGQDIRQVGGMLAETWDLKRSLADAVSTVAIDDIYSRAVAAGALGGKILGAGGGGFALIFVEPRHRAAVRAALYDLIEVPLGIDREGSRIILYANGE